MPFSSSAAEEGFFLSHAGSSASTPKRDHGHLSGEDASFALTDAPPPAPGTPGRSVRPPRRNRCSIPLGAHKVTCAPPGLTVTTQVHRRSVPVTGPRRIVVAKDDRTSTAAYQWKTRDDGQLESTLVERRALLLRAGEYVEVLETQVHGERVRGRICWEVLEDQVEEARELDGSDRSGNDAENPADKILKKETPRSMRQLRKQLPSFMKRNKDKFSEEPTNVESVTAQKVVKRYEGWISLRWAKKEKKEAHSRRIECSAKKEQELRLGTSSRDYGIGGTARADGAVATDEDVGPWTVPVPLGVFCISSNKGVPMHESPDGTNALVVLGRGQYVEVVQTLVKARIAIWARVIVSNGPRRQDKELVSGNGRKGAMEFTNGWIRLLNVKTGLAVATPVPLGAYVIVEYEPGCNITEGAHLDSKEKGPALVPGSCIEVVATRLEEGVVRGLIARGGYVTLFRVVFRVASNGNNSRRQKSYGGTRIIMNAMPVPLGLYQIIQGTLTVTSHMSSASSCRTRLALNSMVEIVETYVEKKSTDVIRVRGRVRATNTGGGGSDDAGSDSSNKGWITVFEVRGHSMRMYAHPKQYT